MKGTCAWITGPLVSPGRVGQGHGEEPMPEPHCRTHAGPRKGLSQNFWATGDVVWWSWASKQGIGGTRRHRTLSACLPKPEGHCCGECGRDGTLCCRVSGSPAPCIDACMFSIPCRFFFVSARCFCSSVFAQAFLLTPCVFSASSVIMLLSADRVTVIKKSRCKHCFFSRAEEKKTQNVQYVAKIGFHRTC